MEMRRAPHQRQEILDSTMTVPAPRTAAVRARRGRARAQRCTAPGRGRREALTQVFRPARVRIRGMAAVGRGTDQGPRDEGCARTRVSPPGSSGDVVRGARRELDEVAEPGQIGRGGVLAQRDDVVLGTDDQQGRRRDLVIFVADRLLIDHPEGKRSRAGLSRVIRAEGDAHQHVGQRLPYLGVGMNEVALDLAADDGRVSLVHFVLVKRLLRLRGDAHPVVRQAKRVLQESPPTAGHC